MPEILFARLTDIEAFEETFRFHPTSILHIYVNNSTSVQAGWGGDYQPGSDLNDGLSRNAPKKTIAGSNEGSAIHWLNNRVDTRGLGVIINVAGLYPRTSRITTGPIGGGIFIRGNPDVPYQTRIIPPHSSTPLDGFGQVGGHCFGIAWRQGNITISDMYMETDPTDDSASAVRIHDGMKFSLGANVKIGPTGGAKISVGEQALGYVSSGYTTTGDASSEWAVDHQGQLACFGQTITFEGASINYDTAFAFVERQGLMSLTANTYANAAIVHGRPYHVKPSGVLVPGFLPNVIPSTDAVLPGDLDGIIEDGGLVVRGGGSSPSVSLFDVTAGTPNIGAIATGSYAILTGDGAVNSFGPLEDSQYGLTRLIQTTGVVDFVHNVPTGGERILIAGERTITSSPGDLFVATFETGNTWHLYPIKLWQGITPHRSYAPNGSMRQWLVAASLVLTGGTASNNATHHYTYTGSVGNMTLTRQAGDRGGYAARVQRTSGSADVSVVNHYYRVPERFVQFLRGKKVKFSYRHRTGANFSGATSPINFISGTGSEEVFDFANNQFPTGNVDSGNQAFLTIPGTNADVVEFSGAYTIPTTANELMIRYGVWVPSGTAGADDWSEVSQVKLEWSSTHTAFQPDEFDLATFLQDLTDAGVLMADDLEAELDALGVVYEDEMYHEQTLTSSGTWTPPAFVTNDSLVQVILRGGGGGGGSGARRAAGTASSGGAGGGGAGGSIRWYKYSELSAANKSVTVGTAGTGGAAVTANDTDGNAGTAGGTSSFSSGTTQVRASPGQGGMGGRAGLASTAGTAGAGTQNGTAGGAGANGANGAAGASQGANLTASSGGGAGAGQAAAAANFNGGNGGNLSVLNGMNSAGGVGATKTNPTTGVAASSIIEGGIGAGGAGGWAASDGTASDGSVGGNYGAGGGGGGSSVNGSNSGAGANGTGGIAVIRTLRFGIL